MTSTLALPLEEGKEKVWDANFIYKLSKLDRLLSKYLICVFPALLPRAQASSEMPQLPWKALKPKAAHVGFP